MKHYELWKLWKNFLVCWREDGQIREDILGVWIMLKVSSLYVYIWPVNFYISCYFSLIFLFFCSLRLAKCYKRWEAELYWSSWEVLCGRRQESDRIYMASQRWLQGIQVYTITDSNHCSKHGICLWYGSWHVVLQAYSLKNLNMFTAFIL